MQLRARVVFRASCTARRRIVFPKSSSWSMRLRRRARDGRRAWDCRARDFDRVSGRRQQPRQCSARRCCGELQKSFAAAEASCTPLLLVLWTMGCVCVLGVVAARPGLIGVPWSPHKPTGKRGLDVLSAVAKRDVDARCHVIHVIPDYIDAHWYIYMITSPKIVCEVSRQAFN